MNRPLIPAELIAPATRSVAEDCVLAGQRIASGDLLNLSYICAKRDESVFADPYEFRPERSPNRHVAFGYGGHICLGQHLARLEMTAFWRELFPRLEAVGMARPCRTAESEFVCGPKSVPVRLRMR